MIVDIVTKEGIGAGRVLRIEATQVLVRQDNGTPFMLAAAYGGEGTLAVGSAYHDAEEFNLMLRRLGVQSTVIVDRIQTPAPPPGARLVSGS